MVLSVMKLTLTSPSVLRITDFSEEELMKVQSLLKYRDKSIEEQIRRTKNNPYFHMRMGQEQFQLLLDDLNSKLFKSLLMEDGEGYYTLPGLLERIQEKVPSEYVNMVDYPDFGLIPWLKPPTLEPYDFQVESVGRLTSTPHSHVELATGLGKGFLVVLLVKETGLPTIISTPSVGLTKSMYNELVERFGKKRVGMLGGSRKDYGKDILVCVGKSLSMVRPEDYHKFEKYKVFISDECHRMAANDFSHFNQGVLGHVPYRWYLSATPERNDGRDLLLEGIIGKKVYEMTIQEGIEKKYLSSLNTMVFDVESDSTYLNTSNVVKMNQSHFYRNDKILDIIARIVPEALSNGIPTIILVDEHAQEEAIRNRIGPVYEYARGGTDTDKICSDFNSGKIMCVVGTSAVSTGTNFRPVQLTINWQGGKAETKFKQGVIGRSTRIHPESGKTSCRIIDFRVTNISMLKRHANARISLYKDIGPVKFVEYK